MDLISGREGEIPEELPEELVDKYREVSRSELSRSRATAMRELEKADKTSVGELIEILDEEGLKEALSKATELDEEYTEHAADYVMSSPTVRGYEDLH